MKISKLFLTSLSLSLTVITVACGGGSDDSKGGDGDGDGDSNGAFCATFCQTALEDVDAVGCENEDPLTQEAIDECEMQCERQLATPCGDVSETFWQCTLDEYPAVFECGDDGKVSQPDACDDEQQAVLDCFDELQN